MHIVTYPEVINEQLPDRVRCISYVNYTLRLSSIKCNSDFLVMDEIQGIIIGLHCSFKPKIVTALFLCIQLYWLDKKYSSRKRFTHFSERKWPNHHKSFYLNMVYMDHFCMRPANARRRYIATTPLIGWPHWVNKMQWSYLLQLYNELLHFNENIH